MNSQSANVSEARLGETVRWTVSFVVGRIQPAQPKINCRRQSAVYFFATGGFEDELQECEQKKALALRKCFFITFSVVYTKSTLQGGAEEVL